MTLISFILIITKSYGQIVINTIDLQSQYVEIPNGTYIKDLNNTYSSYIGTWQATWQGKTFKLIIAKESQVLKTFQNGEYYYRDYLYGKYIITNNITGEELENTSAITDFNF